MDNKNKVLIIGIDAFDPKLVRKLMDKLPNFRLLETFKELQTTIPPETPVAWSAAATGLNPGGYGIFDFINRDLQTYLPKLNLVTEKPGIIKTEYSCAMKGDPFWRILNKNNIKSTIIRWPVTFPAEKVNGKMLSGLGVVDIKGMLNSYSFYTNDEALKKGEGKEKVIPVEIKDGTIETYISGPLIRKGGTIKDVRVPMKIKIKDREINISINKEKHLLKPKQWSNIIRTKFSPYLFVEIYGIFNFYLDSIKPNFKLYMSSIQIDPMNQVIRITYPKEYGKKLANDIGLFYTLGMSEDTKAVTENKLDKKAFYEQIQQIEEERKKMFFYEFERFEEGVYAFVFDAGDRLKHIFWDISNTKNKDNFIVPKEIENYYLQKDKLIGEVVSRLDDNTKLIILSDHGFGNFQRQVNINSWLVKEGYMKTKSNTSDLLFQFVNWERTKAYSLGFTSLYLNLKGREGNGIVDKEEKDGLINDIIKKLRDLKDGEKPVFRNIYKSETIYSGRYSYLAPDIVLGFSPGYRMAWKSAVGSLDKEIIFDNDGKWRGDHLIDRSCVPGVLFTNFKINKENPNIMDIAPTVLKFFNVRIPENMDGEVLI